MAGVKRRLYNDSDICALYKELDEVTCPICMDYPHNAVLLICSSHNKGCRSYICDTSYRHSNCLDRFKKLMSNSTSRPTSLFCRNSEASNNSSDNNTTMSNGALEDLREDSSRVNNDNRNNSGYLVAQVEGTLEPSGSVHVKDASESELGMKCPLCLGTVLGQEVIEEARNYLNLKSRNCSREACSFVGNYMELRKHARRVHPMSRPSDIDPTRERAWRRLEHRRDYVDTVSAIRSAVPGAVIVGDYVIENGDGSSFSSEGENEPRQSTFFLFQMIGSLDSGGGLRSRNQPWRRHPSRRSGGVASRRRMLWDENLWDLQDEDEDKDTEDGSVQTLLFSDGGEDGSPNVLRRRRRLVRSRSIEDQQ